MNLYGNKYLSWFIWKFILRHPKLRLFLVRLLVTEKEMTISLLGSPLCINTVEEIGYWNAWKNAGSNIVFRDEVPSLFNLALILQSTDTFVDIGANVGLYSSILGRIQNLFPQMPWYAFEANPLTVSRLKQTLKDRSVTIEQVAVSDKKGTLSFSQGAASNTFASVESNSLYNDHNRLVSVEAITLNDYDLKGDSLVFKIDVEGHEWSVLQGADRYFNAQRVKAVFMDGFSDPRIAPFLLDHGFKRFHGRTLSPNFSPEEGTLFVSQNWLAGHST